MPSYADAADRVDRWIAQPWFLPALFGTVGVLYLLSVDASNFFISIVTALALVIGNGSRRRFERAVNARLDELVNAIPNARNELGHLEDRCEEEIEGLRL